MWKIIIKKAEHNVLQQKTKKSIASFILGKFSSKKHFQFPPHPELISIGLIQLWIALDELLT